MPQPKKEMILQLDHASNRPEKASQRSDAMAVCVRICPHLWNAEEGSPWKFTDDNSISDVGNDSRNRNYSFDRIFNTDSETQDVYDEMVKTLVRKTVCGLNGTVFAYGQTGSGKTHTMVGTEAQPGVMKMAFRDAFEMARAMEAEGRSVLVRASYVELHNEELRDLLAGGARHSLKISEHANHGTVVSGLTERFVVSPEELDELVASGQQQAHFASHHVNERSSRSHCIFRMTIESWETRGGQGGQGAGGPASPARSPSSTLRDSPGSVSSSGSLDAGSNAREAASKPLGASASLVAAWEDEEGRGARSERRISYLNLVDLAGSERSSKTGAEGATQREGAHINRSLTTLGMVIHELSRASSTGIAPKHVPYRDSKLTHLLRSSLGGNAKTVLICGMLLGRDYRDETHSTLRFATRARQVVCYTAVQNAACPGTRLKWLSAELRDLTLEQDELRKALVQERVRRDEEALRHQMVAKVQFLQMQEHRRAEEERAAVEAARLEEEHAARMQQVEQARAAEEREALAMQVVRGLQERLHEQEKAQRAAAEAHRAEAAALRKDLAAAREEAESAGREKKLYSLTSFQAQAQVEKLREAAGLYEEQLERARAMGGSLAAALARAEGCLADTAAERDEARAAHEAAELTTIDLHSCCEAYEKELEAVRSPLLDKGGSGVLEQGGATAWANWARWRTADRARAAVAAELAEARKEGRKMGRELAIVRQKMFDAMAARVAAEERLSEVADSLPPSPGDIAAAAAAGFPLLETTSIARDSSRHIAPDSLSGELMVTPPPQGGVTLVRLPRGEKRGAGEGGAEVPSPPASRPPRQDRRGLEGDSDGLEESPTL